jgi:hypothetical protein
MESTAQTRDSRSRVSLAARLKHLVARFKTAEDFS